LHRGVHSAASRRVASSKAAPGPPTFINLAYL
jgi:hypothetical protein